MVDVHCHRCKAWIGESPAPLRLVGLFQTARDREKLTNREYSWRCKGCGWTNVFEQRSWRDIEIKKGVDGQRSQHVG